jgi:hypothetical protein
MLLNDAPEFEVVFKRRHTCKVRADGGGGQIFITHKGNPESSLSIHYHLWTGPNHSSMEDSIQWAGTRKIEIFPSPFRDIKPTSSLLQKTLQRERKVITQRLWITSYLQDPLQSTHSACHWHMESHFGPLARSSAHSGVVTPPNYPIRRLITTPHPIKYPAHQWAVH